MKKAYTLCFIHKHPKILLGMKKIRHGKGKWNGFGGHVEPWETIEDAAKREIKEEAGIEVRDLKKVGIFNFEFKGSSEIMEVHVFKTDEFSGTPMESDEMIPKWFFVDEIPFKDMWSSDVYWFPMLLKNRLFTGRVLFDESYSILEKEFKEVKTL